MRTALKWAAFAWLGVAASTALSLELIISDRCLLLAQLLASALIPFLVPPFLLVATLAPAWGSLWLALGLFAIATYLWLLSLLSVGLLLRGWNRYAPLLRSRPPRVALY